MVACSVVKTLWEGGGLFHQTPEDFLTYAISSTVGANKTYYLCIVLVPQHIVLYCPRQCEYNVLYCPQAQ